MVTAERAERQTFSETQQTTTVPRRWLLTVQVRNLLSRTTDISQSTLEKIDKGLRNQWIETIVVYGLDDKNRCHIGLELTINWMTCGMHVYVSGDKVIIDRTVYTADDLAPEVMNAIEVFNQAVMAEDLRTKWRVIYAENLDGERINQELGFVRPAPLSWVGKISKQSFRVKELPELTVSLLVAESAE
jgi:hypothetical protein